MSKIIQSTDNQGTTYVQPSANSNVVYDTQTGEASYVIDNLIVDSQTGQTSVRR